MTNPVDDELLLARFRKWLQEARAEAERWDHDGDGPFVPEPEVREIGLYQLLEEFTALRHELKLQTRSTRNLQEQAEPLVAGLQQAIEQFRSVEAKEAQAAWTAGKPLAEALADLDEALDRGRVAIEASVRRIVEEPTQSLMSALEALHARQPLLRRFLVRSYHEQVKNLIRDQGQARQDLFDSLLEGYSLIQNRLRRALKAEQIHRIESVGAAVDPELMNVVEVVDDPGRPPGRVVEEVRRGYTWRGRLLRYAEVRASRGTPT